jgi:hypothetical protein
MSPSRQSDNERPLSPAQCFRKGGVEPTLEEVLSDPIVQLVARSDGLSPAELRQVIAACQLGRRTRA